MFWNKTLLLRIVSLLRCAWNRLQPTRWAVFIYFCGNYKFTASLPHLAIFLIFSATNPQAVQTEDRLGIFGTLTR